MGFGRFVHLIGSAFLLVATALLIVASVSAPVVDRLALFKVELGGLLDGTTVNFGTFGHCVRGSPSGDYCSGSHVGYNPASFLNGLDGTDFGDATRKSTKALTNVMVLHAVAAAFAFVAFLLSVLTGIVGGICSSLAAVIAFIITAVALVVDFVLWSLIRHDVNDDNRNDDKATYGPAIWCVLAAGVLCLLAAIIVFITCCAGRRRDRHAPRGEKAGGWNNSSPTGRRMPWNRRANF